MKTLKSLVVIVAIMFMSCEGIVDGINDNPNKITPDDVEADLFLNGAMLANTVAQLGHMNRIAGMWSGQLIGFQSLYSNIYGYNISTAEAGGTWNGIYVGVLTNVRHIRATVPNDALLVGISKVLEAHAIGTAASLFGDVPYSEANDPAISDPKFDSQVSVLNAVIALLDEATTDLSTPGISRALSADIYNGGNAAKWLEVANTLKARYYLQMKNYPAAYNEALNGISSNANNLRFIPRGSAAIATGDKNLYFEVLSGSRQGDIGTGNSYLMDLLAPGGAADRNNAKTDETARLGYSTIIESSAAANQGIAEQFEPMNFVTYAENLMILAECEARANGLSATALGHLNEWRAFMNTGGHVNANFQSDPYQYDPYVAADFAPGGMENADNIADVRAFLREVIEERYVSGFGMHTAFNDVRRLAKSDADLIVPFPFNTGTATQQPQRMPYSDDEINANANAPVEPGIYATTEVNK